MKGTQTPGRLLRILYDQYGELSIVFVYVLKNEFQSLIVWEHGQVFLEQRDRHIKVHDEVQGDVYLG